jgi:hypothetical protein
MIIALICLVVGGILILGWQQGWFGGEDKDKDKDEGGSNAPGPSPGPETIVIGGEEEQTGDTEGYVMMANKNVPLEVSAYNLYAYNPNSTSYPDEGGADIFNEDDGKCPDGTLDCLYFERITDGRVTDITDKDDNKLVQQFVNDFYDGKLPLLDDVVQLLEALPPRYSTFKLSEDNKLMNLKVTPPESEEETETTSWVKVKPGTDMSVGEYLIKTMALYKLTGKPKPNVVIDLPVVERGGPTDIEQPA